MVHGTASSCGFCLEQEGTIIDFYTLESKGTTTHQEKDRILTQFESDDVQLKSSAIGVANSTSRFVEVKLN